MIGRTKTTLTGGFCFSRGGFVLGVVGRGVDKYVQKLCIRCG